MQTIIFLFNAMNWLSIKRHGGGGGGGGDGWVCWCGGGGQMTTLKQKF